MTERMKDMRKTWTMVIVATLLSAPTLATAADQCPAELSQAKAMLGKATTVAPQPATTAPRQLAGAKSQDIQAPRAQDIQAPRAQDIQAPRAQAPKAGATPSDIQAPRSADSKARLDQARKLISDSEAACKKGDIALSSSKAKEAIGLLK